MNESAPVQLASALAIDAQVPWHRGEPFAEQRALERGDGYVDLSHFGVVQVSGAGRLPWLHLLLTQAVDDLAPHTSVHALVLSANGHIEHDIKLVDDGDVAWLVVEPGTATALAAYLDSMVFMHEVSVEDVSDQYAVVGMFGHENVLTLHDAVVVWKAPPALAQTHSDVDPYVPQRPSGWQAVLAVVPRDGESHQACNAGLWAWEATRVAAAVPRLGLEIDHRTLPHEVGLIGSAVHLHKGCYRGQEAVARTINLGRPPRRLVLLHLDGSSDTPPAFGSSISGTDGREVGRIATAIAHHELGDIALAVVRRATPETAQLTVTVSDASTVHASQEPVVVISESPRNR